MSIIVPGAGWGRELPPRDDELWQTVLGSFQLGDLNDCEFSRICRHQLHMDDHEIEWWIAQFKGDE